MDLRKRLAKRSCVHDCGLQKSARTLSGQQVNHYEIFGERVPVLLTYSQNYTIGADTGRQFVAANYSVNAET